MTLASASLSRNDPRRRIHRAVHDLLRTGLSPSQVARELGVSRQRVHQLRTGYQSPAWRNRNQVARWYEAWKRGEA